MATKDLRQLHRDYTHALLLAGRQWRRVANAAAELHGISDATALPLVLIGRMDGDPRQNALAEAVGIEGPSLVRLLDQLEKVGLVLRKEDPLDRRAKVLSLTTAGKKVVTKMEADLTRLRETVFADVCAGDLEASMRVFTAIQNHGREPLDADGLRTEVTPEEAAE
ncbi:MarR family winged helix-turn-helix transcriptional regulator [Methylobacterium flocculans]|uniref:MarR family winged helix-turn-helix transcriptional regulator n=1 Tax=Methylobacterium flocculans TaxID=2984843 RepID=UPI0021F395B1|nr:MarR family transcriptional regulator [Methylobacterium sp. FF17]